MRAHTDTLFLVLFSGRRCSILVLVWKRPFLQRSSLSIIFSLRVYIFMTKFFMVANAPWIQHCAALQTLQFSLHRRIPIRIIIIIFVVAVQRNFLKKEFRMRLGCISSWVDSILTDKWSGSSSSLARLRDALEKSERVLLSLLYKCNNVDVIITIIIVELLASPTQSK